MCTDAASSEAYTVCTAIYIAWNLGLTSWADETGHTMAFAITANTITTAVILATDIKGMLT